MPPVPRCNVEELLAIEAPRKLASPVSPPVADSDETAPQSPTKGALQDFQSTFGVGNPLPPIPATPESGAESNPQSDASRMKESPEIKEEEAAEAREASQFDGEAFFMTQVSLMLCLDFSVLFCLCIMYLSQSSFFKYLLWTVISACQSPIMQIKCEFACQPNSDFQNYPS